MRTMLPEMDAWVAEQECLSQAKVGRGVPIGPVLSDRDLDVTPPCPLTDDEIDWLWPRYQKCSFPPATFAKRFAGTARERLTAKGKNAAVSLSFRYRRQIFGLRAVKWTDSEFIAAIKRAASKRSA